MSFNLLDVTQSDYEFNGLKIHQPTIKELGENVKEEQYLFFCLKAFGESLKELFSTFGEVGNMQEYDFLYILLSENFLTKEKYAQHRIYLLKFLNLLFPNSEIEIYKENIMIKTNNIITIIDDSNLQQFKQIIRKMFKLDFLFSGGGQPSDYNPVNEKARQIAEKFKKSQVKIAAQKGEENKLGIIENYISILSVGLKTTPKVISEQMTLYNLLSIFERFRMQMEWDLDIKVKLAGGGSENRESPKVWFSII